MTYVHPNFKTKKALKQAVKDGEHINVYQPGLGSIPINGTVYLEGPHYPKPHTWYAEGTMQNGALITVK